MTEWWVGTFKEPVKWLMDLLTLSTCLYITGHINIWYFISTQKSKVNLLKCLTPESGVTSHMPRPQSCSWQEFHRHINGILPLHSNAQISVLSLTYLHSSPICFIKPYLFISIIIIITSIYFTKGCGFLLSCLSLISILLNEIQWGYWCKLLNR